jgi:hypothetical protein
MNVTYSLQYAALSNTVVARKCDIENVRILESPIDFLEVKPMFAFYIFGSKRAEFPL